MQNILLTFTKVVAHSDGTICQMVYSLHLYYTLPSAFRKESIHGIGPSETLHMASDPILALASFEPKLACFIWSKNFVFYFCFDNKTVKFHKTFLLFKNEV